MGDRLEYRRDAYGRTIEEKLFDGRVLRYELDAEGRQKTILLPDGRTVSQKFDPVGRLVLRESSDGLVEEFVYDKSGRVVKASNNHSVVEMIRNNYGDVRIEIQNGQTVIYLYDQNRNRKHRCLPVGGAGGMLWRSFRRARAEVDLGRTERTAALPLGRAQPADRTPRSGGAGGKFHLR